MSIKNCPRCQTQARCTDSRQMSDYVRRRYRCTCGHTWTTAEFLIAEGDDRSKNKVEVYRERMGREAAIKAVERVKAALEREAS